MSHCDLKKAKSHVTRPRRSTVDPKAVASRGAGPSGAAFGRTSFQMRRSSVWLQSSQDHKTMSQLGNETLVVEGESKPLIELRKEHMRALVVNRT